MWSGSILAPSLMPLTSSCFALFARLRDRGFFLTRMAGWLVAGWLLWFMASYNLALNSVRNAWLAAIVVALTGLTLGLVQRRKLWEYVSSNWRLLLAGGSQTPLGI